MVKDEKNLVDGINIFSTAITNYFTHTDNIFKGDIDGFAQTGKLRDTGESSELIENLITIGVRCLETLADYKGGLEAEGLSLVFRCYLKKRPNVRNVKDGLKSLTMFSAKYGSEQTIPLAERLGEGMPKKSQFEEKAAFGVEIDNEDYMLDECSRLMRIYETIKDERESLVWTGVFGSDSL
jgi:hypothetical protein